MNKSVKILLGLLLLAVVALAGGYSYMLLAFPKVSDAPDLTIEITPERLERGEYLAMNVAMCIDCHSERDYGKFAAPLIPGTFGMGGEVFDENMGLPGSFHASNITPAGLKDWTDGELYRAITAGVSRDGRVLFPIMPYPNFAKMATEDIYSIIAYIRTLDPIEHDVPKSKASFPMNLIMRTIPADASPATLPDPSDKLAWGAYLTNAASCGDCHTPMEKGEPLPGMEFAGGMTFAFNRGTLRAVNITPDSETGIGAWTEDMFVQRFKAFVDSSYVDYDVPQGEFNTIMPWKMYALMTEHDLRSIYTYLKSLKPVKNPIERFTPEQ